MSSREKHRGMPTKHKIFNFWKEREDKFIETRNGRMGIFDSNECFACGFTGRIHRAHIIPIVYGGNNEASNIHLLCTKCHIESEGLKKYWEWLSWKRKNEWKNMAEHIADVFIKCGIDIEAIGNIKDLNERVLVSEEIMKSLFWR